MIAADVWHYDGRNANKWRPRLMGDAQSFRLINEDWKAGPYLWTDLIALDTAGPDAVVGHRSEPGWRIGFEGEIPAEVAALLPHRQRYGGIIDRVGLWQASAAFAVVAALVVFAVIRAPNWIAPMIPQSWEDKMGDAMVGDFGGRFCHSKEGDAALRALVAQMDPDKQARSIEVANIPMVNAIALPGRRVILFDGLIKQAETPDEVAGVLAHELGHVEHRHTLTAMLRQMGLSVILGGLDGAGGAHLNALLGLSFSRDAEHEADMSAIGRMKAANVSPAGTAAFFKRMDKPLWKEDAREKESGAEREAGNRVEQATNWLASHPSSKSRYDLFIGAVEKWHEYRPALSR